MARELEAVLDTGRVLARASAENFPVSSRLLPRAVRADLVAVYGFARLVDDVGDEAPGDRVALLDWLGAQVDRIFAADDPSSLHPLMARLARTVQTKALPRDPFDQLIEANRQDQVVHRYQTFEELLRYCELSANPVGRLVLSLLADVTPQRIAWSDAICTGLQLTEHWQDVAEDADRGRIYLPAEDLDRFGVPVTDLTGSRPTPSFRRLMAFECERARALLDAGLPLVGDLPGRAALAIAAFVSGGRAALAAIATVRYDVLSAAPRPTRRMRASAMARTLIEAGPFRRQR